MKIESRWSVEVNEGDYNLLKCLVKAGVEDTLVKVN